MGEVFVSWHASTWLLFLFLFPARNIRDYKTLNPYFLWFNSVHGLTAMPCSPGLLCTKITYLISYAGIWAGMCTVRYFDGKTYEWVGISRQPNIMGKVCPVECYLGCISVRVSRNIRYTRLHYTSPIQFIWKYYGFDIDSALKYYERGFPETCDRWFYY